MSDERLSENLQKYENYKEQFKRLNSALTNGFNLEALFIEYAIMEDRTESILRHAEKWEVYMNSRKGRTATIDSKIRAIQKMAEQKNTLPNKYFSDDLLIRIIAWKEDRNRLIHALIKQQFEHNEIRTLAEQGKYLANELRNRAGNYNRAIDRRKAKEMP